MFGKDLNKSPFLLCLFFFLITFSSCKRKEIPDDLLNSPVLFFKGMVNGDSLDLTAGVSYNEAWGASETGTDGILLFTGGFNRAGDSPLEFSVIFRDSVQRSSLSKEEALIYFSPGGRKFYYEIEEEAQTYSLVNFSAVPPPPGLDYQYKWIFEDGFISYFPSVTYKLQKNTYQPVQLITFLNGSSDTLVNYFQTDENGLVCPLQFSYYPTLSGTTFNAVPGFSNYQWTFPDGTILSGENVNWTAPFPGKYKINCSATGNNGCTGNYSRVLMHAHPGNASADYTYKFIAAFNDEQVNNSGLNQIEIKLKGNWKGREINYSSRKPRNNFPSQNHFTITKAEPFADYKGTPTIKVEMNFSGYLYNVLNINDSLFVESENMVMAFGYKNSN